jgi:hypothetical protein
MAGRIGPVQKAQDGKTYGFVVFDEADRPSLYLGFGSWHDADRAAREAQGLLVTRRPACDGRCPTSCSTAQSTLHATQSTQLPC